MQVIIEESEYKRLLAVEAHLKEVFATIAEEAKKSEFAVSLNDAYTGMGGYREYPVSFIICNPSEITKELVKRNAEEDKEIVKLLGHLRVMATEVAPMLNFKKKTMGEIIKERHGYYALPYEFKV